MTDKPITERSVIIADDDDVVREALADLIADHPTFVLAGAGESGWEAAQLANEHDPDLAIVDVMMPGGGVDAVALIHAERPVLPVFAFTANRSRRTRSELLESGARAVFIKGDGTDLLAAIEDLL